MSPVNTATFIERTVQKTHEWLNEICEITGRDDEEISYQMLRGVLHVLRDNLTLEESVHLGAQLPMLIRGLYYEGFKPSLQPARLRSMDEFVQAVSDEMAGNPQIDPQDAIVATMELLSRRISRGEIQDIRQMMPAEMKDLWPEESQEF